MLQSAVQLDREAVQVPSTLHFSLKCRVIRLHRLVREGCIRQRAGRVHDSSEGRKVVVPSLNPAQQISTLPVVSHVEGLHDNVLSLRGHVGNHFCGAFIGLASTGENDVSSARLAHPLGHFETNPTQSSGDEVGRLVVEHVSFRVALTRRIGFRHRDQHFANVLRLLHVCQGFANILSVKPHVWNWFEESSCIKFSKVGPKYSP